jgi:adenine deaminase
MARNVSTIWDDVKDLPYRERLTFCTDDREADDILEIGQLDDVLRHAMKLGMEPVEAIRSASLRTAEAAKLENIGAVAPGYVADFLLVDDLKNFRVHQVFAKGKEVARDGKLIHAIPDKSYPIEERNSVNLPSYDLETFTLRAPEDLANQDAVEVNLMAFPDETSLYASLETVRLPLKDGVVDISGEPDLAYVAVMNRYGTGDITLGLVRKFGLNFGAKASTISHDCHKPMRGV